MKRFLPLGSVVIGSFLAGVGLCGTVRAGTISQWTFETPNTPAATTDSANGPTSNASTGTGAATGVHTSALTDWSAPVGNGSAASFNANNWAVGDYWQFQLSTLGFTDIAIAFDQTSSGTGPRDFKLAYSINNIGFTDAGNYTVLVNGGNPNPGWNDSPRHAVYGFSFDLSSIASIENNGSVFFRLSDVSTVSANNGTVGGSGTNRVDNFTVTGTEIVTTPGVPESGATILLLGLSLVPVVAGKKLKRG